MHTTAVLSLSLGWWLLVCPSPIDDAPSWPGWRGPARDGISTETNWRERGAEKDLWKRNVGLGYSAVAIDSKRLYTMGFDQEAGVDVVWCLDPMTGEEIWKHRYPAKIWNHLHGGGTLTTPTIHGDAVYTLNREGNLHCFEAETGKVRWHVDVTEALDAKTGTWGFAASPLVEGDELLVNVGKLVALDRATGETRWQSKDYGHSYSTPSVCEVGGKAALAVFNSNGLAVIEREGGRELFFHEWRTRYDINAATPIVTERGVFISSGLGRGAALLAFGEEGFDVAWENKAMRNKMSGCVLIDGHLYGFDESVLKCIDLDGNVKWSERGLGNGAVTGAPGKLLVMSGKGELIVAKASPEKYDELSKSRVIDAEGVFWTMPVLAGGLIYCRGSQGELVCRDHRED
ncbi:MAG: PQQ-binding-like beta-propeller repeat protein [bacterium]|nr:PQQ-binding-like beta-propeller repeat protein [bacterium]